jgi:hypothetical protein
MSAQLNSPKEIYQILVRIVKAWPETYSDDVYYRNRRINTFAAIPVKSGQNSHNLQKDSRYKDKDYFYSRKWAGGGFKDSELEYDYPALVCVETQDTIKSPFDKSKRHTVNLAFFLTDLMPQKLDGATPTAEQRTFEQVGEDLRRLLDELLREIGQFVWSRYDDGGGWSAWAWNSEKWIDAQGYASVEKQAYLRSKIKTKEMAIAPAYGYWGDNLAEFAFQLEIELTPCQEVTFDYTSTTETKLPDVNQL